MAIQGYGVITAKSSGQTVKSSRSATENPIIIIPGVMGSRFFTSRQLFDNSTRVWDPVVSINRNDVLRLVNLGEQFADGVLYVRPFENQNYDTIENAEGSVRKYGREYGAINAYEFLVNKLCESFPMRKIYFFSYDWRSSNTSSAENLYIAINGLNSKKVNLVCHSMGGLVASKYYQMYKHHNQIDKIITCATPYEGAPKLINSIMNWDILGEGVIGESAIMDFALGACGVMRKLKASFRGVAELVPTKNYVSQIPMQKLSYSYNVSLHRMETISKKLTYEEYIGRCEAIFNEKDNDTKNYQEIRQFQDSLLADNGYNALLGYKNAFFAIGVNYKTITSIRFNPEDPGVNKRLYEDDLQQEILGDGTVPYLSSTMMGQIPNVLNSDRKRWIQFAATHTGIVERQETLDWIVEILKYS